MINEGKGKRSGEPKRWTGIKERRGERSKKMEKTLQEEEKWSKRIRTE